MGTAASILRVTGAITAAAIALLLVMFWLHAQATNLATNGDPTAPLTVEGFLTAVQNPPVCYYEGYSEHTQRPESARDWVYTLVLGDCHPQRQTLPRILIDALLPEPAPLSAGSVSTNAPNVRVQYTQTQQAEQLTSRSQETH